MTIPGISDLTTANCFGSFDANGIAVQGAPTTIPQIRCLNVFATNIIAAVLYFSGAALIVIIIIAGYKYLSSRGDEKKLESAKMTLIYAVIGIFLIFFAFAIVKLIIYIVSPTASTCFLGGIGGCNF